MPKYLVEGDFSGYVRGCRTYVVEAESEEQARKYFWKGDEESEIIRDDTEFEISDVTIFKEDTNEKDKPSS